MKNKNVTKIFYFALGCIAILAVFTCTKFFCNKPQNKPCADIILLNKYIDSSKYYHAKFDSIIILYHKNDTILQQQIVSYQNLYSKYVEEINNIRVLSADSIIKLYTRNLARESGNKR